MIIGIIQKYAEHNEVWDLSQSMAQPSNSDPTGDVKPTACRWHNALLPSSVRLNANEPLLIERCRPICSPNKARQSRGFSRLRDPIYPSLQRFEVVQTTAVQCSVRRPVMWMMSKRPWSYSEKPKTFTKFSWHGGLWKTALALAVSHNPPCLIWTAFAADIEHSLTRSSNRNAQ